MMFLSHFDVEELRPQMHRDAENGNLLRFS
jgi:hypothetical protein